MLSLMNGALSTCKQGYMEEAIFRKILIKILVHYPISPYVLNIKGHICPWPFPKLFLCKTFQILDYRPFFSLNSQSSGVSHVSKASGPLDIWHYLCVLLHV